MKRLLLVACSALLLSSCQQKLYFPDRAVTPLLSERYQTKIALSVKPQSNDKDSLNGKNGDNSFAADACFAVTDHIGVFASYRGVNHRVISEDYSIGNEVYGGNFSGHRWEGGVGYFSTFGKMGRYEAYGGYGQGILNRASYYTPTQDFNTHYRRYFVQGAAGAGNKLFSASGGIRLAYQRYYDFTSANDSLRYEIMGYGKDVTKETVGFLEPFINGEIGYKWIKFNAQFGWSVQTMGAKVAGNTPFYLHIGGVIDLAPSYFRVEKARKGR